MRFLLPLLVLTSLATGGLPALAAPQVGDPAPAFAMQGSDGNTYSSESLAGKNYVIAFFPKAFTGG